MNESAYYVGTSSIAIVYYKYTLHNNHDVFIQISIRIILFTIHLTISY